MTFEDTDITKIEKVKARKVIEHAYNIATERDYQPNSRFSEEIFTVLSGTHLTFKYIMVNALLAKASIPQINPLCLQKQSELLGAYDARSICHEVLVPFERNFLDGALGASNEPFLNKPARYTELSTTNASRRGKDRDLLHLLIDFLPQIKADEAFDALITAIYFAIQLSEEKRVKTDIQIINEHNSFERLEEFIHRLLERSCGGETLALAIGTLMNLLAESLDGKIDVEVHVVNQSGASSREISDIDVYRNNQILYAIEAKDKEYSPYDVQHAVRKAAEAGCGRLMFVTGPQARLSIGSHGRLVEGASKMGVYLTFFSISAFTKNILSLVLPNSIEDFLHIMLSITKEARLKDETIDHMLSVAKNLDLIN